MSFHRLSYDSFGHICSYLELQDALNLLATGNKYFSALFSPGVFPFVSVDEYDIAPTFRKTLIYFLNYHRHIETYKVRYNPWEVALPFISEIPADSALRNIIVVPFEFRTSSHTFKARDRDRELLISTSIKGCLFPSFGHFRNLYSLHFNVDLPSARELPSYTGFWSEFLSSMPRSLREIRLQGRGYLDLLECLHHLPEELESLNIEAVGHSQDEPVVTAEQLSCITFEILPNLKFLALRIPDLKAVNTDNLLENKSYRLRSKEEVEQVRMRAVEDAQQISGHRDPDVIYINARIAHVKLLFTGLNYKRTLFVLPHAQDAALEKPRLEALNIRSVSSLFAPTPLNVLTAMVYTLASLPSSLEDLNIGTSCKPTTIWICTDNYDALNSTLMSLPPKLKSISLGTAFCGEGIEAALPRGLLKVHWDDYKEPPILNVLSLPPCLTHIDVSHKFESIESLLSAPKSLTYLKCHLWKKSFTDREMVALQQSVTEHFPQLTTPTFIFHEVWLTDLFSDEANYVPQAWSSRLYSAIPLLRKAKFMQFSMPQALIAGHDSDLFHIFELRDAFCRTVIIRSNPLPE